jgi:hypothetical protein
MALQSVGLPQDACVLEAQAEYWQELGRAVLVVIMQDMRRYAICQPGKRRLIKGIKERG